MYIIWILFNIFIFKLIKTNNLKKYIFHRPVLLKNVFRMKLFNECLTRFKMQTIDIRLLTKNVLLNGDLIKFKSLSKIEIAYQITNPWAKLL